MNKDVAAVCGRINALLAECIAGRPASIDRVTVKNSLAQLPEDGPVTRFLDKFFDVVIAHTSALGSGSLASPAKIATAKKKLDGVMEAWPKTTGDPLAQLCGLGDPNLQLWTTGAVGKMAEYHVRSLAGGHKELDALVAMAQKLLDRVPEGDEGKFREKMRKDGSAIAKIQSEITEVLARMKTSDPSIDEEHPADQGHGREDLKQVRESFKAGTRLDDFCYYYTCLYVGLTLFNGPTIRNDSEQGRVEQDKLKGVLQSMQNAKQKPTTLPDSVSNMCSFIDVPSLVAASPSARHGATSTMVPEVQPAPKVQAYANQLADQQQETPWQATFDGAWRKSPSKKKEGGQ